MLVSIRVGPAVDLTGREGGWLYLLLGQVVGQVGDHDLGLGGNTVGRRATLLLLAGRASLVLGSLVVVSIRLVGDVRQR